MELSRGLRTPPVCKKLGISEQTYSRWRKEYGGLRLDQAKRLKELERENTRLKKLVADQALDHAILKVESFNGKLRDELLDREIFYTLTEAKILIERWRREYNTVRPHSALGYRPPAPAALSPAPLSGLIMSPALS